MQLKRLLVGEEWDLRKIFKRGTWVDGFWPHLAAHIVGGIGLFFLCRHDLLEVTKLAVFWVLVVDEINTTVKSRYPIWAILWDSSTVIATAWALSRWIR